MQNRKLTLFSWGDFDHTTRNSAKVRYQQVFSMKLLYFLEILLQQSYMHVFHCNGPKFPKCANTEKSRTDGDFMGKQFYNAEFSVETRLEHGFAIENTYFL